MQTETKFIDVDGPVHYVDYGGKGRAIVLVHGLGGSALNFHEVGTSWAKRGRVVAVDLAGFGLTPPAGRAFTLDANRELLSGFISSITDEPAVLIGNSMGGLLSIMQAVEEPDTVEAIVLLNPAIPPAPSSFNPSVITRLVLPSVPFAGGPWLRAYRSMHSPESYVRETFKFVAKDPDRISADMWEDTVAFAHRRRDMPWAVSAFAKASQSMASALTRRGAYKKLVKSVEQPTLLIHGDSDRVVSPRSAEWLASLRPDWEFIMLEDNGHVPHIETPAELTAIVDRWLKALT